ncbi:MAG: dockerin type I domain-containing protein, partial [Planctomycetota bacterium]
VDDGFVAYVNGTEIGRFNVAKGEVLNSTPAIAPNPLGEPVIDRPIEFPISQNLLVEGENIIAVSVHNAGLGSSDLTFIPTLIKIPGEGGGPGPQEDLFLRGDVDDNGFVNLTDAVSLLLYLFQQGNEPSCTDSTDIDDNGFVNLTDGVSLLNHLFRAGPAPQAPGFLECGVDPTAEDALGNCSSSACTPAE